MPKGCRLPRSWPSCNERRHPILKDRDKVIKEGVIGMRRKYGALFCLGLSAVCAVAAVEGPLVLSNQYLRVEVDQATGRFSIAGNPDG